MLQLDVPHFHRQPPLQRAAHRRKMRVAVPAVLTKKAVGWIVDARIS